jgi:hypothetical protein
MTRNARRWRIFHRSNSSHGLSDSYFRQVSIAGYENSRFEWAYSMLSANWIPNTISAIAFPSDWSNMRQNVSWREKISVLELPGQWSSKNKVLRTEPYWKNRMMWAEWPKIKHNPDNWNTENTASWEVHAIWNIQIFKVSWQFVFQDDRCVSIHTITPLMLYWIRSRSFSGHCPELIYSLKPLIGVER